MRRMLTVAMLLLVAVSLIAALGCQRKAGETKPGDANAGAAAQAGDVVLLEYDEIDIIPGAEKQVAVKSGKAVSAEAHAGSGITAKVEDNTVKISAAADAKEGAHAVKVKDEKGNETALKVNLKPAGAAKAMPPVE
jgi:hypothetical protein